MRRVELQFFSSHRTTETSVPMRKIERIIYTMRFSTPRPFAKLATSVALAGTLGLAGGAVTLAQDATPAGTPIGPEASCIAPTASGDADTGAATTMASPVATEAPEGTPVEDQAVIDEATAFVQNLYACYNAGDGEAFLAHFTENGHAAVFGDEHDDAELAEHIAAKSAVAQASEVDVHEVVDYGDGTIGVDYQVLLGQQIIHNNGVLTQVDGGWLIDGRTSMAPETQLDSTTASVKASVDGDAVVIEVSPSPLANQPAVKLQITNNADSAINVLLLQGGDAASVTSADLTALPEGVTFVGDVHNVGAGEIVDTAFEGLAEGQYVIVVQTADGATGSYDLTIDPPFDPEA